MYLVLLQNEENKMLNNLKDHKIRNKDHYFPRNPTNNELIIQGKKSNVGY